MHFGLNFVRACGFTAQFFFSIARYLSRELQKKKNQQSVVQ